METLVEAGSAQLIQLITKALLNIVYAYTRVPRRSHVDARCVIAPTFVVPATSTFTAGRRTSETQLIISSVHPPPRCLRPRRNNICRSCSNIFPLASFYFHRRSSRSCLHNGTSRKVHSSALRSALYRSPHRPTHSRPRGIELSIWICIVWTEHRETISVQNDPEMEDEGRREPLWKRNCGFYS